MSWYRRWGIIGVLALAQVGVVLCYQGFLSGTSSPASAATQEPPADKKVEAPQLPVVPPPVPGTQVKELTPPAPLPDLSMPEGVKLPEVPAAPAVSMPTVVPVAAQEKVDASKIPGLPVPPVVPAAVDPPMSKVADPLPQIAPPVKEPVAEHIPKIPQPPAKMDIAPPPPALKDVTPYAPPPPDVTPKKVDAPTLTPAKHQTAVGPCPWTLKVEIIKGKTQLTASIGKEVQFRIACENLDLQAPRGIIDATGQVTLTSEGLDGTCDRLQIAWVEDVVILEGKANLKCQREGQEVELKGAKMSLRLSASGVVPVRDRPQATQEPPVSIKSEKKTVVPVQATQAVPVPVEPTPSSAAEGLPVYQPIIVPQKIQD